MINSRGRQGFTLIELVITVGILSAISVAGFVSFGGFRDRKLLEGEVSKIEVLLNDTRQKAIGQQETDAWGARFINPADGDDYYVAFAGSTFAGGDQRQRINLPNGIEWLTPTTGDTVDVLFSKAKGLLGGEQIVDIGTVSGSGNYKIVITTLGKIEKLKHGYGLQGYWKLDEPSGTTTARDFSGQGNNLTLTSVSVAQTGKVGRAFVFNGSSSYATSDTATTLGIATTTTGITVSAWFKTSGTGETYLFDNYDGSTENFSLRVSTGKIETYLAGTSGTNGTPQYGSGYNDGEWHQVVLVWDGSSTESVYVDGSLVGTTGNLSLSGTFESGSAFRIGARPATTTYFDGSIDEVRVWSQALSAQQVKDIYKDDITN